MTLARYDDDGSNEVELTLCVESEWVDYGVMEIVSVIDQAGKEVTLRAEETAELLEELYADHENQRDDYSENNYEEPDCDRQKEADQLTAWENSRIPHYAR